MARNYLARSYRYYRKHGYWKSVGFLGRKLSRKLAPAQDTNPKYITRFADALTNPGCSAPPSPASALFGAGLVAIIGDLGLQQCKKYRVLQKLECVGIIGLNSNYSHWNDLPRCFDLLQVASVIIFYRVQANSQFDAYLAEARRLGLVVLYDIDDPIFDQEVYAQNPNLGFLAAREMRQLLSDSPSYAAAINQCDAAIVSTPGMRDILSRHFSGDIYLWRNAIDHSSVQAADIALNEDTTPPGERIIIGYASGSRAHEADFRVVTDALVAIMEKYPETDLKVLGHLELPGRLKRFSSRISEVPFSSYSAYFRMLKDFDISIVPLVQDDFNACKSAIRYLEAALVNVPTIVSDIGDFTHVIPSDDCGRRAASQAEWFSHLEELINSPETRREIAKNARADVLETQTTAAVAQNIDGHLSRLLGKASDAG